MAAGHGFSTDVGEYHEPYIWSWIIGSSAGVSVLYSIKWN